MLPFKPGQTPQSFNHENITDNLILPHFEKVTNQKSTTTKTISKTKNAVVYIVWHPTQH